jgi:hypothetical protein
MWPNEKKKRKLRLYGVPDDLKTRVAAITTFSTWVHAAASGLNNIPTADTAPNLTLVAIANRAAKSGDKTGAPCHVRLVLMR